MAKTSKVEDYWRQHCIESLFKELTQILARRMPSDPAVALVEHIQKKYPKSFKISTDNIGIVPKTLANNLQLNAITSPVLDIHNESAIDIQTERRSSTQSQTSGSIKIPTVGSAFTDLLKQDTSISQATPAMNIRNIVFANRLGQQVVRLGKDIRSDHDILEEELIKPTKMKSTTSSTATTNVSTDSVSVDFPHAETHDEPSVLQLIKYKQQIHIENDRRLHREKLAELAKSQRGKEQFFHSDASLKPDENQPYQHQQQQQGLNEHETSSQVVPIESSSDRLIHKPFAKSKEEEEILNDENIFQPRKQRFRGRPKQKLTTTLMNTLHARERRTTDFRLTSRKDDGNLVCKVCGNLLNVQENQSMTYSQQLSITPIPHALALQTSVRSIEKTDDNIDDWFESASGTLNLRHSTPIIENNNLLSQIGSTTFRRDLFRPIHANDHDTVQHESTARPLILSDEEAQNKRFKTPCISESGVFSRSPVPTNRSPVLSQAMQSPVAIMHQSDTSNTSNRQSANILIQNASARSTPSSTFTARRGSTNDRRKSEWSVCERSPDDTDEN